VYQAGGMGGRPERAKKMAMRQKGRARGLERALEILDFLRLKRLDQRAVW
jgi:hypothetical protein